jgi:hypothetical protein
VFDCNSSALTLFDRHRGEVKISAAALRRFDGLDQNEPYRLPGAFGTVGEGWAK